MDGTGNGGGRPDRPRRAEPAQGPARPAQDAFDPEIGSRHDIDEGSGKAELDHSREELTRGFLQFPQHSAETILFRDFRADPVQAKLRTPSGKIELFSSRVAGFGYADCPGHAVWQPPAEWLGSERARRFPLHLLSNQPSTRLHSQYDHGAFSRDSKIQGREPLTLNRQDAAARGIRSGDLVRVFNDRGALLAGAALSDGIRPGVAQIATGAWYDPVVPGEIGSLDKHGNPNVLARDSGSSSLSQSCTAQSNLVEVEHYAGPVTSVTAFDPPPFADA
jgi:biotin/methionine sulfoxide reductase